MALKIKRKDMKRIYYGVVLIGLAFLNSQNGLSFIEQLLSTLISVGVFCLLELVSINEKLDK